MKGVCPGEGKRQGQQPRPIIYTRAAFTPPHDDAPERKPRRPAKTGHAAAMEEYKIYKAAGMLREWRERWRHVLAARHH